jgi:hypothetical protein
VKNYNSVRNYIMAANNLFSGPERGVPKKVVAMLISSGLVSGLQLSLTL